MPVVALPPVRIEAARLASNGRRALPTKQPSNGAETMASVFKRTITKPIPPDAKIAEAVKPLPKSAKVSGELATWTDRSGAKLGGPVAADGKVIVKTATLADGKTFPLTADGGRLVVGVQAKYSAKYKNAAGRWVRRSTGTVDKAAAQRNANQWEAEASLRRSGVIDRRQERREAHAQRPIGEHLQSYVDHMATKGGTAKHRKRTKAYIQEFIDAGDWQTLGDIDSEHTNAHAAKLRKGGMAARTIQARLRAVKGFTRWLVGDERLASDPLFGVKPPNPKTDRRIERRMLLPDEWPHLLAATEAGPDRNGLTGSERATLYWLAIQTGLRANETSGITRGSIVLTGERPYVVVKAAGRLSSENRKGTKNKQTARQYIEPDLARRLAELCRLKAKATPLFPFVDQNNVAKMAREDLAAARLAWIKAASDPEETERRTQSTFLASENEDGETFDYHALRHTCGAWLAIAGVHAKTIQTVMRHGSITLTFDTYGHLMKGAEAEAVRALADVMAGRRSLDVSAAAAASG